MVEWPRGEATACKAVYTGSNPVSTSKVPTATRAISSVGEHYLDTVGVTGSIPVSPTIVCAGQGWFRKSRNNFMHLSVHLLPLGVSCRFMKLVARSEWTSFRCPLPCRVRGDRLRPWRSEPKPMAIRHRRGSPVP